MIALLLLALAQDVTEVRQGVYDKCVVENSRPDLGAAPGEFSITIHEIKNYTHRQVTGRYSELPGNKVHWLSGPLAELEDATYIQRGDGAPQLRFQSDVAGVRMNVLCTWTQE